MKRIHLFELEDQSWFPSFIRSYMTDYLHFAWGFFKLGEPLVPIFKKSIEMTDSREVVDLCSGGGGPILFLQNELRNNKEDLSFTLTDFYPNSNAFSSAESISKGRVKGVLNKVDARNVDEEMKGLRTLFSSFHHFRPEDAKEILKDASSKHRPILIAEYTERSISCMSKITLSTLFLIFLFTPFIKNLSFGRLIFTYVIPIVPLCLFWDGIVSCLRTYSEDELRELVLDITPDDYGWEISTAESKGNKITYLLGKQIEEEQSKVA